MCVHLAMNKAQSLILWVNLSVHTSSAVVRLPSPIEPEVTRDNVCDRGDRGPDTSGGWGAFSGSDVQRDPWLSKDACPPADWPYVT